MSEPGTDLADLLEKTAGRDAGAFRALYDAAAPRLYGLALRITRRRDTAEEAVQDVFMKLWSGSARFDAGRGSPLGWLAIMTRNRALDIISRDGRTTDLPAELADRPDPSENALDLLTRSEEADRLRSCLEGLPQPQRVAITAAFFDGLTHEELAEKLASPLGTVKSWVRRGLMRLKGCLGAWIS
jgi:RNA polymerase sigma-70 factor (ECF subfamily)